MIKVKTPQCPCCGESAVLEVNREDVEKYRAGELAQVAFPYLSSEDRERLITGYCSTCYDKLFEDIEE